MKYFYRPQRSWAKVIFSQVCVKNSVHGGEGVCLSACWDTHPPPPRADTPLGADTPLDQTPPPGTRHPPGTRPPGPGTPLDQAPSSRPGRSPPGTRPHPRGPDPSPGKQTAVYGQ